MLPSTFTFNPYLQNGWIYIKLPKQTVSLSLILVLLICGVSSWLLFVLYSTPTVAANSSSNLSLTASPNGQAKIVSMSIIIDEASYFDQLADWLHVLNFRNFTFVVIEGLTNGYILENSTRIAILKQYGEIIPRLGMMQGYAPDNRIFNANFTLNEFASALGYTPKGVMDFVPDTYTSRYLLTRGVEYYQGYCFDQYNMDWITTRGGFQMPYFANSSNILCPNLGSGGMVVLPHSSWDWAASFTVAHSLQLHPLNLMSIKYVGNQTAKNYFLSLIDNSLAGSKPFGYVTVQFEWSWFMRDGDPWQALDWLQTLVSKRPQYHYLTFEDAVFWFKAHYDKTPTYAISFTSPYDGTEIEWLYSLSSRVARIGSNVVSYVDYTDQQPDRYLTSYSPIFWDFPVNSTNIIDNSLSFKVDALGGGYLRAPVSSASVPYDGDLEGFGAYYVEMVSARNQKQQIFAVASIFTMASVGVAGVFLTNRRKRLLPKERT